MSFRDRPTGAFVEFIPNAGEGRSRSARRPEATPAAAAAMGALL